MLLRSAGMLDLGVCALDWWSSGRDVTNERAAAGGRRRKKEVEFIFYGIIRTDAHQLSRLSAFRTAAMGRRLSVGIAEKSMNGQRCPSERYYSDGPGPRRSLYFLISHQSRCEPPVSSSLPFLDRASPRHSRVAEDVKMNCGGLRPPQFPLSTEDN